MEDFVIVMPDVTGNKRYDFYAVLDGHGGVQVSQFVSKMYPKILKKLLQGQGNSLTQILQQSIQNIDQQLKMIGGRDNGSTFCGVLIDFIEGVYYTINIGDSRIFQLIKNNNKLSGQFLTMEHKITNPVEEERIKNFKNGIIINNRLGGNLMISRALGDFDFNECGLTSEPDINKFPIQSQILFIASDGIWDVYNQNNFIPELEKYQQSWKNLASDLVQSAIDKGSQDNISLIILKF